SRPFATTTTGRNKSRKANEWNTTAASPLHHLLSHERDHLAHVVELLQLAEGEADAELLFDGGHDVDVRERVPARAGAGARCFGDLVLRIVQHVAEDGLQAVEDVIHGGSP